MMAKGWWKLIECLPEGPASDRPRQMSFKLFLHVPSYVSCGKKVLQHFYIEKDVKKRHAQHTAQLSYGEDDRGQ